MNTFRWILAAALAANAGWMLVVPQGWYHAVPGVDLTGPLNLHFVRDIGCAYLVAAIGLAWRVLEPVRGASAALVGATFLLLPAGVHVGETLAGICGWGTLLRDVPGVVLPAVAALVLAWPARRRPG